MTGLAQGLILGGWRPDRSGRPAKLSGIRMGGCRNCSAAFDFNGQNRLAEINSNKSLSLREAVDTTRRACAPPVHPESV